MSLGVHERFADFTIIRRIGAGGMGEVYLAQHPRLPRRDALKLLAGEASSDPEFRERFLREADLAATLWHQHIVGVHDRGEFHGQLWLSMDYVDGEDASTLLKRQYASGMPIDLVTEVVTAMGSALDYAHGKGLLHRDIKPANILLTKPDDNGGRRILLSDFGIARTMDDRGGLTATNMTVGTVDYVAPEQLLGETLDGRADQYALAATAYHLLTGTVLFPNSNAAVVISHHLRSSPPPLSAVRPDLAAFDPVFTAALAKDPNDRFATCTDFAKAFAARRGLAAAAPTIAAVFPGVTMAREAALPFVPPPAAASPPESIRTRRAAWAVFAAVALGALALIGGFMLVSKRNNSTTAAAQQTIVTVSVPLPQSSPSLTISSAAVPPSTVTVTRPSPVIVAPTVAASPLPTGVVIGTCDEGGSCGVQQRIAPHTNATRLYPDDLRDGMTVTIACQTTGDARSSAGHSSSKTWVRLTNGAYVNSVYLDIEPAWVPYC
ncbi:serine/threonine-protein kinase [Mycobacterium sp. SMC-17]|uniref:serine/threonine-protein kinase n=1 Tax=Mycobacterium sp. SMC-17 TaxID=3381628 RepID=UPI003876889A